MLPGVPKALENLLIVSFFEDTVSEVSLSGIVCSKNFNSMPIFTLRIEIY
jgi:hypothetical protein